MKHRQYVVTGIVGIVFGVFCYYLISSIMFSILMAIMSGYMVFCKFNQEMNLRNFSVALVYFATIVGIDSIEEVRHLSAEVRGALKLLVCLSFGVGVVMPVSKKRETNA